MAKSLGDFLDNYLVADLKALGGAGGQLDDTLGTPNEPDGANPSMDTRKDLLDAAMTVEENAVESKRDKKHVDAVARVEEHAVIGWKGSVEHKTEATTNKGAGNGQM